MTRPSILQPAARTMWRPTAGMAVEDGRRFLAQWGTQADALSWTAP
jgi:hypothetical protein